MPTYVSPEGPLDAKIALVGEAPGVDEIREGRPFVGQAGKLLNTILHMAGLSRHECYITNVVKERPPNNDISVFVNPSTGFESDAYKSTYKPMLFEELQRIKPNVIVALGQTAMYALTGFGNLITKRRGSYYQTPWGTKVMVTCHPSASLHGDYLLRFHIAHDLKRAAEERDTPEIQSLNRQIFVRPSFADAMGYLTTIFEEKKPTAFDIEISRKHHHMTCFSMARSATEGMSIPLVYRGVDDYFNPDQEGQILRLMARILEDPDIPIWGQNLIFDTSFLVYRYGIATRNIEDTMIMQGILLPDFPKSLAFICSIYTTQQFYKDTEKDYTVYRYSDDDFWRYSALDSIVVQEALPKIREDLLREGLYLDYCKHRDLINPFMYMFLRGMRINHEGLIERKEKSRKRVEELTKQFQELCGEPVSPTSSKQLATYFYVTKGYKAYTKRGTGKVTTDAEALARLARKGSKEASVLLEHRSEVKLLGSYFDVDLDDDGRLRGTWNPIGTEFTRVSCTKTMFDTGLPLQTLPEAMNDFIIPDDDMVMYKTDLERAENRVVAYIAPEQRMIEAFEQGIDLHRQTAALIFGKPIEDISDEPGSCHLAGGRYSERFWGKKSNHAFNYGLGADKFSRMVEISIGEATFIRNAYLRAYPGVAQYWRWVEEELNRTKTLVDLLGRKRTFRDAWDKVITSGYSFIPQSTVGGIINAAIRYVWKNRNDLYRHVEILSNIHDAIVIQIPKAQPQSYHDEVIRDLQAFLERPLCWKGREFSIPAEFVRCITLAHTEKIKHEGS